MSDPLPDSLRVMADFECWPVWGVGLATDSPWTGDVELDRLPISDGLKAELLAWADRYDATYVRDDPAASSFQSEAERAAFADDGRKLAERLKEELPSVSWSYRNVKTGDLETI